MRYQEGLSLPRHGNERTCCPLSCAVCVHTVVATHTLLQRPCTCECVGCRGVVAPNFARCVTVMRARKEETLSMFCCGDTWVGVLRHMCGTSLFMWMCVGCALLQTDWTLQQRLCVEYCWVLDHVVGQTQGQPRPRNWGVVLSQKTSRAIPTPSWRLYL